MCFFLSLGHNQDVEAIEKCPLKYAQLTLFPNHRSSSGYCFLTDDPVKSWILELHIKVYDLIKDLQIWLLLFELFWLRILFNTSVFSILYPTKIGDMEKSSVEGITSTLPPDEATLMTADTVFITRLIEMISCQLWGQEAF